jgi:hypothetical protein
MRPNEKGERAERAETVETVERKDKIQPEIKREQRDVLNQGCGDSQSARESRLILLQKMEASLVGSHRALAALDLAAIEQGSRDQSMLCRSFALEMRWMAAAGEADATEVPELVRKLSHSAWNVLRAARLQAALLKRAQGKLHVMANMLAGSERNYAAPLARQNKLRFALPPENRG